MGAAVWVSAMILIIHPRVIQRRDAWIKAIDDRKKVHAINVITLIFMCVCFSWNAWNSNRFIVSIFGVLLIASSFFFLNNNIYDASRYHKYSPLNFPMAMFALGWFTFALSTAMEVEVHDSGDWFTISSNDDGYEGPNVDSDSDGNTDTRGVVTNNFNGAVVLNQ